jgi:hypothetical protein
MNPSPYHPSFTSAHVRANIVKLLLVVGAVASALAIVTEALSLAFPPLTDDQELGENAIGFVVAVLILLVALLEVLIYVATIIFFLIWLYRAADNLPAFGHSPRRLSYSPGWAVGSFFIPFVNLIVPYRAVREVWQKSIPLEDALLAEPSPPASFPIWWLFWLLASFSGNLSARMAFDENAPKQPAAIVAIAAGALSIIAAVMAYSVVNQIDERQEETSRKLRLGNLPGPPPLPVDLPAADATTRQ